MFRFSRIGLLLLIALIAGACASSRELARRSAVALQGGDAKKAYEWAKKALDKDPGNTQARAGMHEAVQMVAGDWKVRVRNLAEHDTVVAARELLRFGEFRSEAAAYRAPVDPDSLWSGEERQMRASAGRLLFEEGEASLANGRPKKAYDRFLESALFDSRRRELDDRIAESFERAVTRVAILPIENQTGRAGLAGELTTFWEDQLAGKVHAPEFRFTRLVPPLDVRNAIEHSRHLGRDEAIRIGRRLGARQVLWGRVYGLESDTHIRSFHDFIYRKTVVRDTSGRRIERYEPIPFEAITREREVTVSVELELISVEEDRALYVQEGTREHRARTSYTSYQAAGSLDDYFLVPRTAGPGYDLGRARRAEQSWKSEMPEGVKLSAFLDRARKERGRRQYEPRYREWFHPGGQPWVFLDDLPPAGDLAFAALVGEWRPVLGALKRLEPVDEADVGGIQ